MDEVTAATIATTPKTQLQPPFGPSVDWFCHPCITTTHLSYSVLSSKIPPPPCAVLLDIYIYNTYIHTYTYMHIDIYILYILYICISYLQFIWNKSKGRCCWRHRWRRAQKQSRWKGFLIGCFHLFPLRFSRIGKKCKTMFLAMPSRHGRCHAWNKSTTSGSLQCKTWPKLKNIAGTQRWRRTTLVWTNPEIRGCK